MTSNADLRTESEPDSVDTSTRPPETGRCRPEARPYDRVDEAPGGRDGRFFDPRPRPTGWSGVGGAARFAGRTGGLRADASAGRWRRLLRGAPARQREQLR